MGQQTIKAKCTWTENCGIVYTLIQLSNGTVASGIDKSIKLWNFRNNDYICISSLEGHTDSVSSLLETKRDNYLISGSGDSTFRFWNLINNQCLSIINIHIWTISSIIELDNNRLITSSWDHTVKIWNFVTYRHVSLEEHSEPVTSMLKLSNGLFLATGSDDNTIKIWNIKHNYINVNNDDVKSKSVATLTGHSMAISCLLQLRESHLVSGSYDGSIKIWDLGTYRPVTSLSLNSSGLFCLISLNKGFVLTGASSNEIYILSIDNSNSLKLLSSIEEHTDGVTCLLQFKGQKNKNKIISGSYDRSIKIWEMEDNIRNIIEA